MSQIMPKIFLFGFSLLLVFALTCDAKNYFRVSTHSPQTENVNPEIKVDLMECALTCDRMVGCVGGRHETKKSLCHLTVRIDNVATMPYLSTAPGADSTVFGINKP